MHISSPAAPRNESAPKGKPCKNDAYSGMSGSSTTTATTTTLTHARDAVGKQCLDAAHVHHGPAKTASVMNQGIADTTAPWRRGMADPHGKQEAQFDPRTFLEKGTPAKRVRH